MFKKISCSLLQPQILLVDFQVQQTHHHQRQQQEQHLRRPWQHLQRRPPLVIKNCYIFSVGIVVLFKSNRGWFARQNCIILDCDNNADCTGDSDSCVSNVCFCGSTEKCSETAICSVGECRGIWFLYSQNLWLSGKFYFKVTWYILPILHLFIRARYYGLCFTLWYWIYHFWQHRSVSKLSKLIRA